MLIMLTGFGEETYQGHLRRKVGDLSDAEWNVEIH